MSDDGHGEDHRPLTPHYSPPPASPAFYTAASPWYVPQQVYPQYGSAPPPPRRRLWPWIAGAGALVVLLIAGAFFVGPVLLHGRAHTFSVAIEVGGTAKTANVLVVLPDENVPAVEEGDGPEVTLPWRQELSVQGRGNFTFIRVQVIATDPKGEVTCRITSNGQTIDEDVDGGGYAQCVGNANDYTEDWTPSPTPPTEVPTGPPPHSDIIPELTLPLGSIGMPSVEDWRERWEMPVPYAQALNTLRPQLPIGRDYQGLRWCQEHIENELTMWVWGDKNDLLYVLVDDNLRTGSAVSISRRAPSPTGC
ncbi:hypothetical protein [Mycolicibacterium sp.]|uniref:hypothetical protein n=1 Tax=Mycolicibacterium sp. TaxID=2320850 RepID=UPI0037C95A1F